MGILDEGIDAVALRLGQIGPQSNDSMQGIQDLYGLLIPQINRSRHLLHQTSSFNVFERRMISIPEFVSQLWHEVCDWAVWSHIVHHLEVVGTHDLGGKKMPILHPFRMFVHSKHFNFKL